MSRPVLIGILGLLVLLVAATLNLWLLPQDDEDAAPVAEAPSLEAPATPRASDARAGAAGTAAEDGASPDAASGSSQDAVARSADGAPSRTTSGATTGPTTGATAEESPGDAVERTGPSFDIVRVDPEGNAVIAGRAKPNARVSVMDGDREIGTVTSDARGEWVFIPSEPLKAGESVIRLRETDPAGTERESDAAVVLVVPEKGRDIAGNPTEEPSTPLAVLVPKDEGGERSAARVLQAPAPPEGSRPAGGRPRTADTEAGREPDATGGTAQGSSTGGSSTGGSSTGGSSTGGSSTGDIATGGERAEGGSQRRETRPEGAIERRQTASAPTERPVAGVQERDRTAGAGASVAAGAGATGETAPTATARLSQPAAPGPLSPETGVTVDVIDYDESGSVVFSGRSDPGARVEVFIDGESVGTTVTDPQGAWSLTPQRPVPPGAYDLRVDRMTPSGLVAARVRLPFVRAGALTRMPSDRFVVIQPGNNLWTIALRVYGDGMRYVQIHEANSAQIRDPDLIYPGQVFGLPRPTN